MVKGFGTTWGALLGGRPRPRSHDERRVWDDMWNPALRTNERGYGSRVAHSAPDLGARLRPRTLTQTRHLGARSGAWSDVRRLRGARNGKKRSYRVPDLGARSGVSNDMGSARVVYPDPPPMRGGFWGGVGLVRSGATALRGSFAQNPVSESGTTWGALRDGLRGRSGATALRGSITQTRHLNARSGVWNDMRSAAWWKKRKQAELRSRAGRLSRSLISEREAESGTTWGACVVDTVEEAEPFHPLPRARNEKRIWKDMRRLTWNYYGLTRVIYSDSPPRSEKRGQERHEERRVVDAMERSGAMALRGSLTQNPDLGAGVGPGTARGALRGGCYRRSGTTALRGSMTRTRHLGARSGVWNDMRSEA